MSDPYQILAPLSADEFEALKADISERGVLIPIEYDEDGNVIDGHHRLRACRELGIESFNTVARDFGGNEEAKRHHVLAVNLARRHVSQEQMRALVSDALRGDPFRSDRTIGGELAVDHKTVGSVRRSLEAIGEIPQSSRRTSDGREYPATRAPASPPPPAPEVTGRDGKTYPAKVTERRSESTTVEASGARPPSPDVEEWVESGQGVQDAKYLHEFSKAMARSDDFLGFDPERIGHIGTEDDVTSLEALARSTQDFLDQVKRARSGLRVMDGGKA